MDAVSAEIFALSTHPSGIFLYGRFWIKSYWAKALNVEWLSLLKCIFCTCSLLKQFPYGIHYANTSALHFCILNKLGSVAISCIVYVYKAPCIIHKHHLILLSLNGDRHNKQGEVPGTCTCSDDLVYTRFRTVFIFRVKLITYCSSNRQQCFFFIAS